MAMTFEDKIKVDQSPAVERGGIYRFLEKDGTSNKLAIVVAGNHRKMDRFVSIITLTSCETDHGYHNDELGLHLPVGDYWVHCGMITYVRRDRLGDQIYKVGKKTMHRICEGIQVELGMKEKVAAMGEVTSDVDYEQLYLQLLHTVATRK